MMKSGNGPLLAVLRGDPESGNRSAQLVAGKACFQNNEEDAKAFELIFAQV
jgi:hypothetical protein